MITVVVYIQEIVPKTSAKSSGLHHSGNISDSILECAPRATLDFPDTSVIFSSDISASFPAALPVYIRFRHKRDMLEGNLFKAMYRE